MAGRALPVVRKELKSYFNSPIAYIVIVAFLLFTAVWMFYLNQFFARNETSLRIYFSIIPLVFIVLVPAITMRSWAEERKSETLELLLTLPFREAEVVAEKFVSACILLLIMVILTLPLPLSLSPLGDFDAGQIFGEYLGVLLIGAAGISIGLFVSSVSSNQITSFVLTAILILALILVNQLAVLLALPGWMSQATNYLSLGYHYDSFSKGLIDSRDVMYYLIACFFFLLLNVQVLLSRKWA